MAAVALALVLTVVVPALPAQALPICDVPQDDASSGHDASASDPATVGEGTFEACVDRTDRRDVFSLDGTAGDGIEVSVAPTACPDTGANLSLIVHKADGFLVGSTGSGPCGTATLAWIPETSQTYSVRVGLSDGLRVDYALTADPDLPTPCRPADDGGSGRDATLADPVHLAADDAVTGCVSAFDVEDVYAVEVANGDSFDLTLSPPTSCADVDLVLIDRSGRELAASRTDGCATESVGWTAAYTGVHRAAVRRVDGAGDYGLELAVTPGEGGGPVDPGWPDLASASIRPGVAHSGGCTANFIFSNADNSTLYIGTASHCVGGRSLGASISVGGIPGAGELVYCSWAVTEGTGDDCPDNPGATGLVDVNDFAVLRIRDEHRADVHPAMLGYGGPTELGGATPRGTHVLTYGNSGLRPADVANAREGVVFEQNVWTTQVYMLPPSIPGDSGSPFITSDGRTVGVLSTLIFFPEAGTNGVVRLDAALEFANANSDLDLELKTWPVLDPGLIPT